MATEKEKIDKAPAIDSTAGRTAGAYGEWDET